MNKEEGSISSNYPEIIFEELCHLDRVKFLEFFILGKVLILTLQR